MRVPSPVRRVLVIIVHAMLSSLAYYLAFVLRLDDWHLHQGPADYADNFLRTLPLLLVARLAALQLFGLNRGLWRYAGLSDLVRLALAILASGSVFFAASTALAGWKYVPHSVHVIDATLAMLLLGGVRFVKRLVGEHRRTGEIGGMRSVIVGAGDAGEAVLREMQRTGRETPVAFVDDDPHLAGRSIHGVRVMGTVSQLGAVVAETGAGEVVVAVPARTAEVVERAVAAADGTGARFRVIPEVGGAVRLTTLKHLDLADLLARPVAHLDEARIRRDIAGRRVLVTGGAGSIGSELVRQCLSYAPAHLTVLERDENALHLLLDTLSETHPGAPVVGEIADVANARDVRRAMETARPDFVVHAAAYKHVVFMESNPCAAVLNNVSATRLLLREADRVGARKFLLISSDKAVKPSSVMGATKRAAEKVLQAAPKGPAVRVAVRFGNVVGSSGSVVPLFVRQIERGGPVTVTHKDATRFFMTIPEASSLVLQASAMADGLEVFHLDMGRPMKIHELAVRMISLAGFVPGRDIEIREIGLRPGEKLEEELRSDDEAVTTPDHPQVRRATAPPGDPDALARLLDELIAAAERGEADATLRLLARLVPEYQPTNASIRAILGS